MNKIKIHCIDGANFISPQKLDVTDFLIGQSSNDERDFINSCLSQMNGKLGNSECEDLYRVMEDNVEKIEMSDIVHGDIILFATKPQLV
jgi:hypothetical protein